MDASSQRRSFLLLLWFLVGLTEILATTGPVRRFNAARAHTRSYPKEKHAEPTPRGMRAAIDFSNISFLRESSEIGAWPRKRYTRLRLIQSTFCFATKPVCPFMGPSVTVITAPFSSLETISTLV